MKKLKLDNVTLLCMTSVSISESVKALMFSSKDIDFKEIKLVSHEEPYGLPDKITFEKTNFIGNIDEWNYKTVFELTNYVNTEYVLLIHDDGFVVNPTSWMNEFLDYDYIGAPWDHNHFLDETGEKIRVGNSVSIRSKKLLDIPRQFNMPWVKHDGNFNEDTQICVWNRKLFIENGIKFAPFDVAKYFSHETPFEEFKNIEPFCFHNFHGENQKYLELINNF